jgi:uncharacterized protein
MKKNTLVIGASENPQRYSNMAINRLLNAGHPVKAIGKKSGTVADVKIESENISFSDIHTVTLYINPSHQSSFEEYILNLKPQRVIFNPGTENIAFERKLQQAGIETLEACTLVMLSTSQF